MPPDPALDRDEAHSPDAFGLAAGADPAERRLLGGPGEDQPVSWSERYLRADLPRDTTVHVTFGYGPRYCLGAALARMELKAVFGQLIPRFPAMRLAVDPATLAVRTDALAKGLVGLPVLW